VQYIYITGNYAGEKNGGIKVLMNTDKRVEVEFCGWQDRVEGPRILLVTELVTKSTVKYDYAKHRIVKHKGGRDED